MTQPHWCSTNTCKKCQLLLHRQNARQTKARIFLPLKSKRLFVFSDHTPNGQLARKKVEEPESAEEDEGSAYEDDSEEEVDEGTAFRPKSIYVCC